jgi:hypothetical protein
MASLPASDVSLSGAELHALNASAFAGEKFEPFVDRMITFSVLSKVIQRGLVEAGPSCKPAVGLIGYRLTPEGWVKFNELRRGRSAAISA